MKINSSKLFTSYINLKSLVKKYEESVNNIQLCYNDMSNYWKDNKTNLFFEKIDSNKKSNQKNLIYLNDLLDIYKTMYDEYKSIGNDIEYNFKNKGIIISKIDKSINTISNLKTKYLNMLNSSIYSNVSYEINNNIDLLDNIKDDFLNLKNKINNLENKIKKIDENIENKISKFNIEYMRGDTLDELWK